MTSALEAHFLLGRQEACAQAVAKPWGLSADGQLCALEVGGSGKVVWGSAKAAEGSLNIQVGPLSGVSSRTGTADRIPDREFQTSSK